MLHLGQLLHLGLQQCPPQRAKGNLESDIWLIINLRMRKVATPHWQPARVKSIMFNFE